MSVLFGFINFDQWCLAAALCIMVLVHEGCMHAIKADRVGLQCPGACKHVTYICDHTAGRAVMLAHAAC